MDRRRGVRRLDMLAHASDNDDKRNVQSAKQGVSLSREGVSVANVARGGVDTDDIRPVMRLSHPDLRQQRSQAGRGKALGRWPGLAGVDPSIECVAAPGTGEARQIRSLACGELLGPRPLQIGKR